MGQKKESTVKNTPLHAWHLVAGANMANFGGYEMPLWYSSVKREHLSVLTAAGLFDTSHMAAVDVAGPGARDLLQRTFTNDLEVCIGKPKGPLRPGRCVYGAFLDDTGCVIDDSIVYQLADGHFLAVVNAGMGASIASHLQKQADTDNSVVTITDRTDRLGKIDIQGPASARIMAGILADPGKIFDALPYFSFKGGFDIDFPPTRGKVELTDGTPLLLSRTGYTGELGFELFMAAGRTRAVWEALMAAGASDGLMACGLAARDSLRGGAVLPLSHQDIGHWPFINHPWPFALPWDAERRGFTKSFIGDQALLSVSRPEFTLPFVGDDLRKVSISDPAIVIDPDGKKIGTVLTCVSDMGIGRVDGRVFSIASPDRTADFKPRGLCCGFVKINKHLSAGDRIQLKDSRRTITVTICRDIRPDRTARRPIRQML